MGWKCDKCGNTEHFVEVNPIETVVTQEKETTKIIKIHNSYRRTNEGVLNVWCTKCDSENVSWVNVPNQDSSYLKKAKNILHTG